MTKLIAFSLSLALLAGALLLGGCPGGSKAVKRDPFIPAAPIPKSDALVQYDKLHLGMSELELSQAYNAPEGKGKGFTRTLERSGNVSVHTISFQLKQGQPRRLLLLEFYRDQLCRIVDRRDHMTKQQADAWFKECAKRYGNSPREVMPGAQWEWRGSQGLSLTYTRDNASEEDMSANVVLVHQPTLSAAQSFLKEWEAQNPPAPAGAPGE